MILNTFALRRVLTRHRVYLWVVAVGLVVPLLAAAYPVWKGSAISVREALADFGVSRNTFGSSLFDRILSVPTAQQNPNHLRSLRSSRTLDCTILGELTREVFKRRFAPKGGHAMSTDLTKKPPATVTSKPQELEHQIRLRAHELYEARGREHGYELEDWLRAEEEMAGKKFRTTTV